jgi:hypothetical protein
MRVNSESVSKEIDESDLQSEKHDEQRIWTWRGISIDVIWFLRNARKSIRLTPRAAAGERRKIDEGAMRSPAEPNSKSDLPAVTDPRETQSLTPATTKDASNILIHCRNRFWESHENWELLTARRDVPDYEPPSRGLRSSHLNEKVFLSITAIDCLDWGDRSDLVKRIWVRAFWAKEKENSRTSMHTSNHSLIR